ncbi:MAG: ribonuclease HII [Dehalococcoidia bacterium]|nr:ribonuclease HII [Dehalococcoidia bacterium]
MKAPCKIAQRPTFIEERSLWEQGYHFIAGIDEVGRGPLAGPVVAAAVILPLNLDVPWLQLVRDSKKLTPKRREFLFPLIGEAAIAIGVGCEPPEVIDAQGIVKVTKMAMCSAVADLSALRPPDFLLIDFIALPELALPQRGIVKGDSLSLSIACASIVAKVTRDRLMVALDEQYPEYGFARHKGYATREHLESLRRLGACPIHRKSFAPVRLSQRNIAT